MAEKLYNRVYNDIIQKIKNYELKPGDKLPTEIELTKAYGVSRITISRALQELENINLIYRVKKSGTFVNGKRNPAKSQRILPILLPFEKEIDYALIDSAQRVALLNNCFTPFFNYEGNVKKEREILQNILHMQVDGLIVYPSTCSLDNVDLYAQYQINGTPLVFVDRAIDGIDAPLVTADNENGMLDMVNRLIKLGHRRIGIFGVNDNMIITEKARFLGYCKALIQHKIPVENNYIFRLDNIRHTEKNPRKKLRTDFLDSAFQDAAQSYLEFPASLRPTAICCINDVLALDFMDAAVKRGVRIPEDLSVTGFDNTFSAQSSVPPLTTIAQDFKLMGKIAVECILAILAGTGYRKNYLVPTEIAEGGTVRAIV